MQVNGFKLYLGDDLQKGTSQVNAPSLMIERVERLLHLKGHLFKL